MCAGRYKECADSTSLFCSCAHLCVACLGVCVRTCVCVCVCLDLVTGHGVRRYDLIIVDASDPIGPGTALYVHTCDTFIRSLLAALDCVWTRALTHLQLYQIKATISHTYYMVLSS